MTTEHKIVTMVAIGNSVAVLTEGFPWIFSGNSPDSMSGRNIESNQACVSKHSAVIINGAIIYASPDGLVQLTSERAIPLTDKVITREQEQSYEPSTIKAHVQEVGRYLAFYGANQDKAFIFDLSSGDFRHFDVSADCGFNSLMDDALYLSNNGTITRWEADNNVMSYVWKSKEFRFSDQSFSCALVDGNNLETVGFKVFCDKQEVRHILPGELTGLAFKVR